MLSLSTWAKCFTALSLDSDDKEIYTEKGQVQICLDENNDLDYLFVKKPVHANPESDQIDELIPTLKITLAEVNTSKKDIVILKPKRSGFEVTAVALKPVTKLVDKSEGGEITLKILKNFLAFHDQYHELQLKLLKVENKWQVFLISNKKEKTAIKSLFFQSGTFGIEHIHSK